jgi:hypothetical protein
MCHTVSKSKNIRYSSLKNVENSGGQNLENLPWKEVKIKVCVHEMGLARQKGAEK